MGRTLSAGVSGCCSPWGTGQLVPGTLLPSQPEANSSASLAEMLLILRSGSPTCPQVSHPTCPAPSTSHRPPQHKHHTCTHLCLIAAQTLKLSPSQPFFWAWIGTNGMEKFSFPPRNSRVSEQWQRDQAQFTPLGSSTREMLEEESTGVSCRGQGGSLRNSSERPGVPTVPTHSPWCFGAGTLIVLPTNVSQMCPCSTTPSTWGYMDMGAWDETDCQVVLHLPLAAAEGVLPQRNSFKKPGNGAGSWCGAGQAQEHSWPVSLFYQSFWNVLLGGCPCGPQSGGMLVGYDFYAVLSKTQRVG